MATHLTTDMVCLDWIAMAQVRGYQIFDMQVRDFSWRRTLRLNFADFLLWQRKQQEVVVPPDETGNSQPANMDEECEVHYVGGVLVVKASSIKTEEVINWDTIIYDLPEDGKYLIEKT